MRKALELALEALERSVATCFDQRSHDEVMGRPEHFVNRAITAIKEALAQPEQEPVAQCTESDSWNCKYCRKTESCKALQDPRNFASPPQRKPLTYGQIRDLWARDNGLEDCHLCKIDDFIAAVRFVEAAHGIKE